MNLNRRLSRLEEQTATEAEPTVHNLTFYDLRRVCSGERLEKMTRWLVGQWQAVKDDPVLELPAVWFARGIRDFLGMDFRQKAPTVQQWLYNGGRPRASIPRRMGFDELMTGHGWFGLNDFGNASAFRFHAPEAIEDPYARRFAREHVLKPVDQNHYYR